MCTSLAFPERGLYGRNLDLEYHFGEQVVLTPRKFPFAFHHHPAPAEHYALLGMASLAGGVPLYAEAANEKGLYMAGLNFPGNAHYFAAPKEGALNLAPYELFPLVLGQCATVAEARRLLEQMHLVAEPFGPGYPLAPLHWQIAGPDGVLVAEPMADGLHLYEDAWGVLTNNPPFPWQQMNLKPVPGPFPRHAGKPLCPGAGTGSIRPGPGRAGPAGGRLPRFPLCAGRLLQAERGLSRGPRRAGGAVLPPAGRRGHGAGQRADPRGPLGRDDLQQLPGRAGAAGLLLQNL